jgi:hypothetical protein
MGVGWGVACANPLCVECVLGAYCFGDGNYLPICDSFSVVCVVALCISVVCLPSVWKSRKGGGAVWGGLDHTGLVATPLCSSQPSPLLNTSIVAYCLGWAGAGCSKEQAAL